jgi:hypothetical protein
MNLTAFLPNGRPKPYKAFRRSHRQLTTGTDNCVGIESGAHEVWICDRGALRFHFSETPEIRPLSEICPEFPSHIDL